MANSAFTKDYLITLCSRKITIAAKVQMLLSSFTNLQGTVLSNSKAIQIPSINTQQASPRPYCVRCLKSTRACLCGVVPTVNTAVRFIFLMHRKEQRDRLGTGTGRLSHLMLAGSRLFVGLDFSGEQDLHSHLQDSRYFPCVLFPGKDAMQISNPAGMDSFHRSRCGKTPLVIVLDGSWSCVKSIIRKNPAISVLPHISFSTEKTSQYQFKRQPRAECLSTIEAVHELLDLFESAGMYFSQPKGAHRNLLIAFRKLVDFQDSFSPEKEKKETPAP